MVYSLPMTRVNIHEAKTHLSRYVKRVAKGETIVVCLRNVPVAELVPLPKVPAGRRRMGIYKGKFRVPKSFFDPLPDDVLRAFEGLGD